MWLAVATLLRQYYKSIKGGDKRFPLKFWAILAVPMILYLIGSNLILSTPADTPYKYYYRVIYRSGTIGASLLFAVAFFVAAEKHSPSTSKGLSSYLCNWHNNGSHST